MSKEQYFVELENLSRHSYVRNFNELFRENKLAWSKIYTFSHFIKTGEYNCSYKGNIILRIGHGGDECICIKDNIIYCNVYGRCSKQNYTSDAPVGVVLNSSKIKHKFTINDPYISILRNADDGQISDDGLESFAPSYGGFQYFPSVSFSCLSRFLFNGKSKIVPTAKMLANGYLTVLDTSLDTTDLLTEEDKQLIDNGKVPYKSGYTIVCGKWHRPGSVLVRHPKFDMLFGQDDGAYFGVQLAKRSTSLETAYNTLMPNAVKRAQKNGMSIQRQGEWYAIETKLKNIDVKKCLAEFEDCDEYRLSLNRDSDESSKHWLIGDIVITKNGNIFAKNFRMRHENGDHDDIYSENTEDKYHQIIRNTAVRSFSEEGVD